MLVDVSLMLELVPKDTLPETNSVVIDVLRASTTILSALECNIPYLIPVETIEEALIERERLAGACYLGGERNRLRPEGFHFGNSPLEYRQISEALPVVYTTTNGTRALRQVVASPTVLVGSLRNAAAVAESLCQNGGPALLVCSGTKGQIAAEDVFCAGAILSAIQSRVAITMTDAARVALFTYQQVSDRLQAAMLATTSGQGLRALGFKADVCYAAEESVSRLVPRVASGRLVAD